jgi:hypothetical protein
VSSEQRRKIEETLAAAFQGPVAKRCGGPRRCKAGEKCCEYDELGNCVVCVLDSTGNALSHQNRLGGSNEHAREASLGPAKGKYQGNAVFDSSGAVRVLPMQMSGSALLGGLPSGEDEYGAVATTAQASRDARTTLYRFGTGAKSFIIRFLVSFAILQKVHPQSNGVAAQRGGRQ